LIATVNVTNNQTANEYFSYQSTTPYFIANDTKYGATSNVLYNNHYIIVNKSGYITNYSYFNITYRDPTINITLYNGPTPVLTYTYPTPVNNFNFSSNWIYINVSSDVALQNMNLNWNGTWYQMSNTSQTQWYLNQTNLVNGTYWYNVSANSTWGVNQNTTTRNVTIDTRVPGLIWIGNTTANNTYINVTSAYFNVSGNEYLSSCLLNLNGLWSIMTRSNNSNFYHQVAGLADTQYIFYSACNDSANNTNVTETRNFTVDTALPVLTFVVLTPPNENITNQTWVFVNVTTNEVTKNATLNFNGTLYYMLKFNDTNWYKNVTLLLDGKYLYFAYANDSAGNWGWSEYRNVTINTTIIVPPSGVNVTIESHINLPMYIINRMSMRKGIIMPIQVRTWIKQS
jgi:hypothetical protein